MADFLGLWKTRSQGKASSVLTKARQTLKDEADQMGTENLGRGHPPCWKASEDALLQDEKKVKLLSEDNRGRRPLGYQGERYTIYMESLRDASFEGTADSFALRR